jgi:hypothetical protein
MIPSCYGLTYYIPLMAFKTQLKIRLQKDVRMPNILCNVCAVCAETVEHTA